MSNKKMQKKRITDPNKYTATGVALNKYGAPNLYLDRLDTPVKIHSRKHPEGLASSQLLK